MNVRIGKALDYYLSLTFPITVHEDPQGGFVAEIKDLPGCLTQAETAEQVLSSIEEAKRAWITAAYEMGQEIPIPGEMDEFKGKVLLRISRSLHRELARVAEIQGVSLNQYASNTLAAGVHGDLLIKQAIDLSDDITTRVMRSGYLRRPVFGNNELPIKHNDLKKLTGTNAPEVN